jgi:hypothetical protein
MKLRDHFPTTKKEAKNFNVELRDADGVFKIFELDDASTLASIEKTIIGANEFLKTNGYAAISPIEFIKNDFVYESEKEVVSFSKHGYLEAFVLFIEREVYTNLNNDSIRLIKDFFQQLKIKTTGYEPARFLNGVLEEINNLPKRPYRNVFVSFEHDYSTYDIAFSDYKIEFSNYVEEFETDENGNKSNFESFQANCYFFEFSGHTDVNGTFDQFREELLYALKKVIVTNISISDEE